MTCYPQEYDLIYRECRGQFGVRKKQPQIMEAEHKHLEKGYFLENNQSIQFQGIVTGGDRLIFFLGQFSKGKAEIGGMSKLPTSEKTWHERATPHP